MEGPQPWHCPGPSSQQEEMQQGDSVKCSGPESHGITQNHLNAFSPVSDNTIFVRAIAGTVKPSMSLCVWRLNNSAKFVKLKVLLGAICNV